MLKSHETAQNYTTKNLLSIGQWEFPYNNTEKGVETEQAYRFEFGFQHTIWNGKENFLNKKVLGE